MRVVTAAEMVRLEQLAFEAHGAFLADNFMERAGKAIARHVESFAEELCQEKRIAKHEFPIFLLCAKGNNSGDAYVSGRYLLQAGYRVIALQLKALSEASGLCQKNSLLFKDAGGAIQKLGDSESPVFGPKGLIIDGLLGTGFQGPLAPEYKQLIEAANVSGLPIVAVDVPSGLDATRGVPTEEEGQAQTIIRAQKTVFLGLPKKGFFLGRSWDYIGELLEGDFGLPADIVEQGKSEFILVRVEDARAWLPAVRPTRHKYEAGTVLGLAGSQGMAGAAILSSSSALRSGCGMVFLTLQEKLMNEFVNSPIELIKVPFSDALFEDTHAGEQERNEWLTRSQLAGACFIGPGLSKERAVGFLLEKIVPRIQRPLVLDADALNHYAERDFKLPKKVIFTPHLGELKRLLGRKDPLVVNEALVQVCQDYVEKRRVTMVVKGAVTFVFHPGKAVKVITLGNPGMAKAGSGDVLTGLIAGLLAQGVSPYRASMLGPVLHGLAGKHAQKTQTAYGLIASDLIAFLPEGFKEIMRYGHNEP